MSTAAAPPATGPGTATVPRPAATPSGPGSRSGPGTSPGTGSTGPASRRRGLRARLRHPARDDLVLVGGTAAGVLLVVLLAWPQLHVSLWLDEATSLVYVRAPFRPFVQVVTGPELNQVLYYVLLRPWAAVVSGPAALRLPSLLFAVATVVAAGDVGHRLFLLLPHPGRALAPVAGAVAALAAGTNGMIAAYGADARGYSLEVLLVTASLSALLRLLARPRAVTAVTWGVLAGLAAYAHFFALLPWVGSLVAVAFALPRTRVPRRLLVLGLVPLAVLVAPIALYVATSSGNTAWVGSPTTGRFTSALAVIAGGDAGGQQAGTVGVLVAQAAVLVLAGLVVCALVELVRCARSTGRSTATFVAALPLALVLVPFLIALGVGFVAPVFFSRYLIVCVPGVVLLVAAAVARRLTPDLRPVPADGTRPGPWLPRSPWEKVTAGAATLGLVAGAGLVGLGVVGSSRCTHDACVRENWSAVADRISGRGRPGDVVVVFLPATVRPYLEAVDQLPAARRRAIAGDLVWPKPGPYDPAGPRVQPALVPTVTAAHPTRVWLVLSHVAQSDRASAVSAIITDLTERYGAPTRKDLRGVDVLLFAGSTA